MVNSMVDRATSSMLIGPDWAMNIEICDICNHDPVQAKEVVKGIKKRIRSKNPKVQLLALTLLETIVKNCGDIVHMHVAERDVLTEMVKIVKKKPDFHVKEKVLTLVDTWQEAFGGARARYPQYFAAYQELLRIGAVFPQRSDSTAPVFTPPQTNPLSSFPQNLRNAESGLNGAESSSAEAEFPTLSLTEIQNARGIMDVLAEMLNAIDPANKEELKQDVIVDLVEQCRNYKQRVVHLVNSTVDESLLEQGLTLNDELQRVLAKHEAIASGTSSSTLEKSTTESDSRALVPVDAPLIDTGDTKTLNQSPTVPSPVATNGPLMDFLSGDDFGTITPASGENSLAIVPTTGQSQPVPVSPVSSDQNALALVDMFSQHDPQQQQNVNVNVNVQSPQYQNGFEQSGNNAWNGQPLQQPASPAPAYGGESGGDTSLPPHHGKLSQQMKWWDHLLVHTRLKDHHMEEEWVCICSNRECQCQVDILNKCQVVILRECQVECINNQCNHRRWQLICTNNNNSSNKRITIKWREVTDMVMVRRHISNKMRSFLSKE